MKKTKITGRPRVPSPFDTTTHKTERTAAAIVMHWMREIITKKNLPLGMPDVDTTAIDRKSSDIVIYERPTSQKALCVIEFKSPYFDVFDEKELKEPARKKATNRKAKYFATSKFLNLQQFQSREKGIGNYSGNEPGLQARLPNLLSSEGTIDASSGKLREFFLSLFAEQERCLPEIPVTAWKCEKT